MISKLGSSWDGWPAAAPRGGGERGAWERGDHAAGAARALHHAAHLGEGRALLRRRGRRRQCVTVQCGIRTLSDSGTVFIHHF